MITSFNRDMGMVKLEAYAMHDVLHACSPSPQLSLQKSGLLRYISRADLSIREGVEESRLGPTACGGVVCILAKKPNCYVLHNGVNKLTLIVPLLTSLNILLRKGLVNILISTP